MRLVKWNFLGLRDINIETHMTALSALHLVVEKFGELEFEIIFNGTFVKRKLVNVVQKRGRETNKIFEYSRNMNSVKRISDSNSICSALIGVGKSTDNVPMSFVNYTPPANEEYIKQDDFIYSVDAFQRYNKSGKQIFGLFFDDVSNKSN